MPSHPPADVTATLLEQWFANCDEDVKTVIQEVLTLELEYISWARPRVQDQIDTIVSHVAEQETK